MRKVKKWTTEEDQYIIANHNVLTRRQIAEKLGRTIKSVAHRKEAPGLVIKNPYRTWTLDEEAYLINNFNLRPVKEIAETLDRTEAGIYNRIHKLGLNAGTRINKAWTQEELFILEEYWGKINLPALCKKLGRTYSGILDQAVRIQQLGPSKYAQGHYTARQLAEMLGVSNWSVLKWIRQNNLPATKHATRKQKVYQIDPDKFDKWAREQDIPLLKKRFESWAS